MPEFDISLYNDEFFEWHLKHARGYSIKTMDWYIEKYKPVSVIDFGAGIGSYLESCDNHNIKCVGLEISYTAKKHTPEHIRNRIFYLDCTKPIGYWGVFNTVLSFETAEHIEPSGTNQFIENIISCTGGHLLFTAAPPGQQGTGHINLHHRDFWIEKFNRLKYDEALTKDISENWRRLGAPDYICNNLIVCTR